MNKDGGDDKNFGRNGKWECSQMAKWLELW
jgi:hypothetical protein